MGQFFCLSLHWLNMLDELRFHIIFTAVPGQCIRSHVLQSALCKVVAGSDALGSTLSIVSC